jgi:hypothetical protein
MFLCFLVLRIDSNRHESSWKYEIVDLLEERCLELHKAFGLELPRINGMYDDVAENEYHYPLSDVKDVREMPDTYDFYTISNDLPIYRGGIAKTILSKCMYAYIIV